MLIVMRFVSLLLGALNLGLAWAHLVEMGPKRAMRGAEWLATQLIYHDYGKVAGITVPTADRRHGLPGGGPPPGGR